MTAPPTAHSLRCGRCNGSFAVQAIEAVVTCPYCGHRQTLARHRELREYEQAVRRRVAAADEQAMVAASTEAWLASRASNPVRNLTVAYGLMLGLPLVLGLALYAVHAAGVLSFDGPAPAFAIGGAGYLGLIVYFVWYFTGRARRQQRATRLEQARVACPTCGAPGLLTPGASVDSCHYCDAALVPTRTMMSRGVDAAREAVRRAALDRRRAQRAAMVKATSLGPYAVIMPVVMIGSLLAMIGATAVGYSVQMLRGAEPFHPAIFILWAMTIAIVGGVATFLSRRRQRRARLRSALGDAVRQLGGAEMPAVGQRAVWLDRYWAGDYDQQHLIQTYLAGAAAVEVGGYAALIDVDLNASRPPPRVDLLLAAWVPEVSDGRKPSKRIRDKALKALGFYVRKTEAGLVARANDELLAAARRDPDVVHVAVPALTRLAQLAAERGFEPVGAADTTA